MLSTPEARAHIKVIRLLDAVLMAPAGSDKRHLAEWNLFNESNELLRVFRPRCPQCVGVIAYGPVTEGRRFFACRCGWGGSESDIMHAVPPVRNHRAGY